jgi:uncharacterized protein (UPF0332 family)
MNKIEWCLEQKRGIRIIEPNNNLSQQYVKSSEENLDMMVKVTGKWKSITAYYACYEAFYALLQKIGIKCEIHDCTLELFNLIEGFDDKLKNFIIDLKEERIDVQYYLKSPKPLDENQVKDFVLSCKYKISSITVDEIAKIRDKIELKKD